MQEHHTLKYTVVKRNHSTVYSILLITRTGIHRVFKSSCTRVTTLVLRVARHVFPADRQSRSYIMEPSHNRYNNGNVSNQIRNNGRQINVLIFLLTSQA